MLRFVDRFSLLHEKRTFMELLDKNYVDAENFAQKILFPKIFEAEKRSLIPYARKLILNYPEHLPISEHVQEISTAIREHNVVIICGTTGSGKTTQLPKIALECGLGHRGCIACTQPRRIAALSLARRFAMETGVNCGNEVGYKIRFDDHSSSSTVVKFMTDGVLLAESMHDPNLYQYDCIILDEVHERTLNIDFLLGYLKLLLKQRHNLKLIISSATLETERLSKFFDNAPVIQVGGRVYPVEDIYLPSDTEEDLTEYVARGIESLPVDNGDILVFLPGEREIRDCADMLIGRNYPNTVILPLFGRMSSAEQDSIFSPTGKERRIILATNVAETSVTIPRIKYVVDSNLVRLADYNPNSGTQGLRTLPISKASSAQRRGRCGREQAGICVHLCSEEQHQESDDFTPPEIQRSSLAEVILRMLALKLPPITIFPFVDPPSQQLIKEGMTVLRDLQAVDEHSQLTETGKRLSELPIGPRLGRILLEAHEKNVFTEILVIISFLAIQDPRERPFEKAKEADAAQAKFEVETSDFLTILKIWLAIDAEIRISKTNLRKFCKKNYMNYRRIMEWRNLTADLLELFQEQYPTLSVDTLPIELRADKYTPIHQALLCGLPRKLAFYDKENRNYYDRTGRTFIIFPGSALAKSKNQPQWLLSFLILDTSRRYAVCCAEVDGSWLETIAPGLCTRSYSNIHWDEETGFVSAKETVNAGRLVIHPGRNCHYGRINPEKARQVFIREGLLTGLVTSSTAPWIRDMNLMLKKIKSREAKIRRDYAFLDEKALENHFFEKLPKSLNNVFAVKKHWNRYHISYAAKEEDIVAPSYFDFNEKDYPNSITDKSENYSLVYRFNPGETDDGIFLQIPETHLNLLSRNLPAYLVPGFLREKVNFLLRSLPKSIRKTLLPLEECTEAFLTALSSNEIYPSADFSSTLSDFLESFRHERIEPSRFDEIELPNYLRMKFQVLNDLGFPMRTLDILPSLSGNKAETVSHGHDTAKQWAASKLTDWPDFLQEIPKEIHLNGEQSRLVYPALFCEDATTTIGCSLFLNKKDANDKHHAALMRLFRNDYSNMFKSIRNRIRFEKSVEEEFFPEYPLWKDDMLDTAVNKAIHCNPADIRTKSDYETAKDMLCQTLAITTSQENDFLKQVFKQYVSIESKLSNLLKDSYLDYDLNRQLAILFRKKFLQTPELVERYPRYLKAITIRLERANHAVAKDKIKGETLEPYLRKFHIFFDSGYYPEENEAFLQYLLLLQEARISVWAPEIPLLQKVSEKTLNQAWENIKLKQL